MPSVERNRHALIEEMERLYLDRTWSDQEMADRIGTGRENVWKIRTKEMEAKMGIPFITEDGGRHRIDRTAYVAHIRLTPPEALALYIGGRRLQQHTKTGQQDVANALEKLANALHRPLVREMVLAAQTVLNQEQDAQQVDNLRKIMEGWMNGRRLRITHQSPHAPTPRDYMVTPYQLEPAVWGDGVYLIGYSDYHRDVATFKLSRIQRVSVTMEPFPPPDDFDSRAMLQHAWGIWRSDNRPETVRLKFSAYVMPYVKETIWHPEQTIQELPEGGCLWQADIAEWREMLPWVRGWGADVEVLGPEELREEMKIHVQKSARLYKLATPNSNPEARLLRLWGKTTKNSEFFHPALYHMLDVAHVAQQLLSNRATPRWRWVLSRALNIDANSLHEWLPWFIALHDIGKISVPFQAQNTIQKQRLEAEGFGFGRYTPDHKKLHHTIMGRMVLKEWAKPLPHIWRTVFLDMVSGHHGKYQQVEGNDNRLLETLHEPEEWGILRQQAITVLQNCLLLNKPPDWPEPENISAAIVALNGFTILCDWLGSDEDYFTPKPNTPILEYLSISRQKAKERVESAGFFVPAVSTAPTTFTELFGWQPRPLQQAIDHIPDHLLAEPTLTIIEAPTGEGKTEAALTLAHRIAQVQGSDEMYIALPTTATSNAMYKRLQEHLQDRLLLPPDLVQLVHGQAFLMKDDLRITPLENGDDEPHPALTWFEPKKKSLLAPFGVGTVDQAELAALNVRHNALRLMGLAGKVVILDEVHAYDTYMTTIIARMLQWLSALGSSVVLLSATLPTTKRQQLAEAYTGGKVTLEKTEAYPYLLTVNSTASHSASPPAEEKNKIIHLHPLHFSEEDWDGKAQWLLQQTADGGCVCWIANTVERAQRTFQALLRIAPDDVDCLLLHARFPLADRQIIEEKIAAKYGKETAERPLKGIVIGTQVLEQSLDIDFDLMVTDLAPIDLLLQRIGRLHRHHRANRAAAHPEPHVYLNYELDDAGQLRIGADRFYTPYILLKTWEVITQKAVETGYFNLPNDYRPLIEAVYGEEYGADGLGPLLMKARIEREKRENKLEGEAKSRLSNFPDPEDPFYEGGKPLFKENEESSDWMAAQTRYQERETITVIPIEWIDENNGRVPTITHLPLLQPANRDTQLLLLQRSIRLSDPEIVKYIKAEGQPKLFTESALLKRCYPLWLENDSVRNLPLRLDKKLGLLLEKEKPHVCGESV